MNIYTFWSVDTDSVEYAFLAEKLTEDNLEGSIEEVAKALAKKEEIDFEKIGVITIFDKPVVNQIERMNEFLSLGKEVKTTSQVKFGDDDVFYDLDIYIRCFKGLRKIAHYTENDEYLYNAFCGLDGIVEDTMKQNPNWRKGQTFFNTLLEWFPEVAEEIRGTTLDPFYHDEKIDDVKEYICLKYKFKEKFGVER